MLICGTLCKLHQCNPHIGSHALSYCSHLCSCTVLQLVAQAPSGSKSVSPSQIHDLKITVLSTMLVGDKEGIGEWGFSALVEADGRRILVDTGARPETVLQNARELNVDLSNVHEVILTHNHSDHVGGLMTLRREMMKKNPAALSVVHVSRGIFYSRPSPAGEDNSMIAIRKEYEATGGKFVEHSDGVEIFPGAWLSGPVPRKYPEHNWSVKGKVQTPNGLVEDTIPEDQSLVLNTPKGLVIVTGCGHAGIVNILTYATRKLHQRAGVRHRRRLTPYAASDDQVNWTADEFKQFRVSNLLARIALALKLCIASRDRAGMSRKSAVVGTVGSTFSSERRRRYRCARQVTPAL